MEKGQWAMPVVQPWHGHSILELDSPSPSTEGALLTKVRLISRPCFYPQAAAARGDVLGLISIQMLQTTVWSGERAEEVFGSD